ncbi:MAG: ACT domain-containing protein, partial [Pseudomonadota bacterium]
RVFRRLAAEQIDVQMVNTSEIKMSVLVSRDQCEAAVRALHAEFAEDLPEPR